MLFLEKSVHAQSLDIRPFDELGYEASMHPCQVGFLLSTSDIGAKHPTSESSRARVCPPVSYVLIDARVLPPVQFAFIY